MAAGRSKQIRGPLSAVLATQLGNTNQVMPGYDKLPAETQKLLSTSSDLGNAFIFAFAGHATFPELWRQMCAEREPRWRRDGAEPECVRML